jgi:hypothetical protein
MEACQVPAAGSMFMMAALASRVAATAKGLAPGATSKLALKVPAMRVTEELMGATEGG